jgi:hypothetical protein
VVALLGKLKELSLSLSLSFERGIRKNTRGALHGKLKELSLSLSRILFLQEEEEEEEEEREREREIRSLGCPENRSGRNCRNGVQAASYYKGTTQEQATGWR